MNEWFKKDVHSKNVFFFIIGFSTFFFSLDTVRVVLPFKDQTATNILRQCETVVPNSLCGWWFGWQVHQWAAKPWEEWGFAAHLLLSKTKPPAMQARCSVVALLYDTIKQCWKSEFWLHVFMSLKETNYDRCFIVRQDQEFKRNHNIIRKGQGIGKICSL